MDKIEEEQKSAKPPYVAAPTLKRVFDLLSTRSFTSISVDDLVKRGFSKSVSFQVLQGLRFLGFVDNNGKTTEKLKTLYLRGEERKQKFQEVIKEAYGKLFGLIQNPNLLSKDDLYNEFLAVYNLTNRLASSATPTFLWLCSEAGFDVKEKQIIQPRKHSERKPSPKTNTYKKEEEALEFPMESLPTEGGHKYNTYPLNSGVVVQIPQDLSVKWIKDGTLGQKLENFEIENKKEVPSIAGQSGENQGGVPEW